MFASVRVYLCIVVRAMTNHSKTLDAFTRSNSAASAVAVVAAEIAAVFAAAPASAAAVSAAT